jgi:hypothetical protein
MHAASQTSSSIVPSHNIEKQNPINTKCYIILQIVASNGSETPQLGKEAAETGAVESATFHAASLQPKPKADHNP